MAEFSELIKNFNKIRDFMRDFYIYGFKARQDFSIKSPRTYDNEKRRCESYLGENFKWTYAGGSKVSFVWADCGKVPANPLFSAWKSKSFTDNDIILHFYILSALQKGGKSAYELTEEISEKSGKVFDMQTVRGKCNEYAELRILVKEKEGKAHRYSLSKNNFELDEEILDAVKFFQSETLGVIGDYILDNAYCENDLFLFKHHYIAQTLEEGVLYNIFTAIREHKEIEIILVGTKSKKATKSRVVPVKILCSFQSGRRYLCAYSPSSRRFFTHRLDAIKSAAALNTVEDYEEIQKSLSRNIDKVWGVSFEGDSRNEKGFSMILHIDENSEKYIIARLNKEGRGGVLQRIGENTFQFSKKIFDASEAMPWVKTFIGRIISFEASPWLDERLSTDIRRMAQMYGIKEAAENE